MSEPLTIPAASVRRLLLHGAGLLDDPARPCTPKSLAKTIEKLGFVQLDTISIVERAHNHIVWSRLHNFQPAQLQNLHARGVLFEHFTHDASLIPSIWFAHWRHRHARVQWSKWFDAKLANRREEILNEVRARIEREGPLLARDFEDPTHIRGTWWDWKPAKAALEYLWRSGELVISERRGFQKVYDLTHRALPAQHASPTPGEQEHIEWACATALERLGVATVAEITKFWNALTRAQVKDWLKQQQHAGRVIPIRLENSTAPTFAFHDVKRRLNRCPPLQSEARVLSPFDPLVRDRNRLERLFTFTFRFEAFVPAAKRTHGYYVLPILRGDRLIARLDPKLDRQTQTLTIQNLWHEPGTTKADHTEARYAIERYAKFCGATRIQWSR